MTGLANRRAVGDRLDELAARGEPAALLLGDLDGLKAINDADGHAAGDAVLQGAARALRDAAGGDTLVTVARLGGDEFCVLMPGANAAEATAFTRLAQTRPMAGATFSWGLALTSARDWKPAALLRAADVAQYEAKRHGGNCLRTAAESITGPSQRRPAARTRDRARLAAQIVDAALGWLDGPGRDASAAKRVQAVAEIAAGALDASSWSVSEMSPDAGTVRTTTHADRRLGADSVVDAHETFLLADTPKARTGAPKTRGRAGTTGRPLPKPTRARAPRGANRAAVLAVVRERPGVTAGELAAASGVSGGTLSALLRRLTEAGELEKRELPDEQTGYAVRAEATGVTPAVDTTQVSPADAGPEAAPARVSPANGGAEAAQADESQAKPHADGSASPAAKPPTET